MFGKDLKRRSFPFGEGDGGWGRMEDEVKTKTMKYIFSFLFFYFFVVTNVAAQKNNSSLTKGKYSDGPDSIAPVGIIKGLSDTALLETVQRQTFRYFWHYAHPKSGLVRERDNTVYGQYYWDWIDEAYDQPVPFMVRIFLNRI